MKPLLLTSVGRTISTAPLGRRGDDVEVRRIPTLPTARSVDQDRPTVIALDHALLASLGDDPTRVQELALMVALVGLGDVGEKEPPPGFPVDAVTCWIPGVRRHGDRRASRRIPPRVVLAGCALSAS